LTTLELIMFKRGVLHVNDFSLDFSTADTFLRLVHSDGTQWLSFLLSFFLYYVNDFYNK